MSCKIEAHQQVLEDGGITSAHNTPSSSLILTQPLGTDSSSTTTIMSTMSMLSTSSSVSTTPKDTVALRSNFSNIRRRSLSDLFDQTKPQSGTRHSDSSIDSFIVPKKSKDDKEKTPRRKLPCRIC